MTGSVSSILPAYTQQIILPEFNKSSNSFFLGNWFKSNRQNLAFQQPSYNFNYNIMNDVTRLQPILLQKYRTVFEFSLDLL